jgi:hypothetical protein
MLLKRCLRRSIPLAFAAGIGLLTLLALGITASGFSMCYNRYPVYPETTAAVGDSIIMQGIDGCIFCEEDIGCIPLAAERNDDYDFIRTYFFLETGRWFPTTIMQTPCNTEYGIAVVVDSTAPRGVYDLDCTLCWGGEAPPNCEVIPSISSYYMRDVAVIHVEGSIAAQTDTWSSIKALFR